MFDAMFPPTYTDTVPQHVDRPALPRDMERSILEYLTPKELNDSALVNKYWKIMANDKLLWKHHLSREFSEDLIKKAESMDREVLSVADVVYQELEFKLARSKNIYVICNLLQTFKLEEEVVRKILLAKENKATELDLHYKQIINLGADIVAKILTDKRCTVLLI